MAGREIIIEPDGARLAGKGAEIFCRTAKKSVAINGCFSVAVSGGSTPRAMHRSLSEEPYASEIPWGSIHIFWTDERVVPFEDPESNFGVAQRDFLDKLTIPSAQVHPMPVWVTPERGAALYQEELEGFFQRLGSDDPAFDLIFLGIGKDGHIASLFPAQEALDERKRWVVAVKGGIPYVSRLTMTYSIINYARQIVFLVSGRDKSEILRNIFEEKQLGLPVQKIQPFRGRLTWLLDQDAASLLVV
jgi:6-phosphogluconolactonase